MRHARADYDRIQDPAGIIGEDEPVFLLRAKDQLAAGLVRQWSRELWRLAALEPPGLRQEEMLATARAVWAHAERMEEWGRQHGTKVPDTPIEQLAQDMAESVAGVELEEDAARARRLAVVGQLTPMQLAELQATEREMRRKEQQAQMEEVSRRRGVPPQLPPEPAAQQALEEGKDSGRAAE